MGRLILGVFLAVTALAWPAAAQEQSASVEGVIKDSQGGVLPGVTVEAQHVQGAVVSAVTDGRGGYRFPSLPPGRYAVTAQLSGFKSARVENLELLLGQIKSVDFTLQVATVVEEVVVKGEAPLVDTRQSGRATSIAREQIEMLPKGRDFISLVTQAPGANSEGKSNGLMIDGATTSENRYIVDGAETSDLVTGGTSKTVLPDFVEEVQVKSSGYTAEFGGATGGVINVVTKSGTNALRGSALFYLEDSRLLGAAPSGYQVGNPTLRLNLTNADLAEFVTYPKDRYSRIEPGFSLGGPLLTNRAWFYAAYQPTLERIQRTVTYRADNTKTETADRKLPSQFLSANLTSQLGRNLRTRVAYNNSWSKTDKVSTYKGLPAADGSDVPGLDYNFGTVRPNYTLSGQADWVVRQNLFVSARAGYFAADQQSYGVPDSPMFSWRTSTIGMAGVPAALQKTTLAVNTPNNTAIDFDRQQRLSAQVDSTWYTRMAGAHTIKGGFQVDRLANAVNSYETGPQVNLYYARDGSRRYMGMTGAFGYYTFRVALPTGTRRGFSTTGDVATNNLGLFIQDAWTIGNRVTLNLGLRTENETVAPFQPGLDLLTGLPATGNVGMRAIKFGFKDKLAPRLGLAWDVNGDGKWKTYASWGVFYDIFKMQLTRGSLGGDKWQQYYYTLETPDWTTLLDPVGSGSCPPACPASMGTRIAGPFDYRAPGAVDPAIKPMKAEEMSAGVEHQLSPVTAVSARYVRKWLDRAVDDIGTWSPDGELYVIGNPGFGMRQLACGADANCPSPTVALPKAKRIYDSVEVALTKNLANRYSARLSYLWSRLYGNYSGLDQTDENGRTSPNTGRGYDYPLLSFDGRGNEVEGPLATDRPHQVKAQVIYQLPFGTTLGANVYVASGIPKTREISVITGSGYPMFYMGRGSDGRLPAYSQTDLVAQHEFRLGGNRRLQLSLNILNLFDQRIATNFWPTENASGKYINFDEPAFYAHQVDVAALKATTPGWKADPRFMIEGATVSTTPGYQMPIQARVGVKLLF
jgi:hypothetical protein